MGPRTIVLGCALGMLAYGLSGPVRAEVGYTSPFAPRGSGTPLRVNSAGEVVVIGTDGDVLAFKADGTPVGPMPTLPGGTYVIAGGYALLHRRHVRIDVIYEALKPRTRARLDAFTFVFFAAYVLTLICYGGVDAWNSFSIGETTSTPWNPVIWPVKAAIPAAGLLLRLQGISNLIRDLGWVPGGVSR